MLDLEWLPWMSLDLMERNKGNVSSVGFERSNQVLSWCFTGSWIRREETSVLFHLIQGLNVC